MGAVWGRFICCFFPKVNGFFSVLIHFDSVAGLLVARDPWEFKWCSPSANYNIDNIQTIDCWGIVYVELGAWNRLKDGILVDGGLNGSPQGDFSYENPTFSKITTRLTWLTLRCLGDISCCIFAFPNLKQIKFPWQSQGLTSRVFGRLERTHFLTRDPTAMVRLAVKVVQG